MKAAHRRVAVIAGSAVIALAVAAGAAFLSGSEPEPEEHAVQRGIGGCPPNSGGGGGTNDAIDTTRGGRPHEEILKWIAHVLRNDESVVDIKIERIPVSDGFVGPDWWKEPALTAPIPKGEALAFRWSAEPSEVRMGWVSLLPGSKSGYIPYIFETCWDTPSQA